MTAHADGIVQLVDCHCHLESDAFGRNRAGIIEDAKRAGLVKLITASIVPEQWDVSQAIAAQFPEVAFALGVHPWYIKPSHEVLLDGLRTARIHGACAIGEIGLDKKSEAVPLDLQRRFFGAQLAIAKDLDLPVVIHCRGAFDDLLQFLKQTGLAGRGGIVHNYSGSVELARDLARYGLSFSLGGTLTYRNSRKKIDVVRAVYPDRLVLETDSPDIPPVEAPGQPNVPANLVYNLCAAAEILGESGEAVAAQTTENARRIFNLDL